MRLTKRTAKLGAIVGAIVAASWCFAAEVTPVLQAGHDKEWRFVEGRWNIGDGVLLQGNTDRGGAAILREPAFADLDMSVDFRISSRGNGVKAAAIIFRATGTLTYYWIHLDSRNGNVIMTRSEPGNTWIEIGGKPCAISADEWHTAEVVAQGKSIAVRIDGKEIIAAENGAIGAGRVGVGTSQGSVEFRNLKVQGTVVKVEPIKEEQPPYKVISQGPAAGTYQAFPDACRLKNGDILAVFYAGYGHVSLPTKEWPRGGRICMVRSRDEGRTWSAPAVLYDDEIDNRDPHVAQLADGTVVCSFFSLFAKADGSWGITGVQLVRSHDNGKTWDAKAETIVPGWAVSAPVRQMPDGTCVLGIYHEADGQAWGGVTRSTDGGKTWSGAIPIGEGSGVYLDAETDVIRLKDGRLFAALRSSKVHEHYAISEDEGLTWGPVQDIGFPGHAPHLNRLRDGTIVLVQRIPKTAMWVSRDETKTWQGPYVIDNVGGAYPSTVELKDGTVLCVYYEEGEGSAVRAARVRIKADGIEHLPL
jgi:ribosomal protein L27